MFVGGKISWLLARNQIPARLREGTAGHDLRQSRRLWSEASWNSWEQESKKAGLKGKRKISDAPFSMAVVVELPKFPLACPRWCCHPALMPHRPKISKMSELKPGEPGFNRVSADPFANRRRRDAATRSTLSRLRNRISDLM
jgi:hypothetical protein